jgi:hypothetical protein
LNQSLSRPFMNFTGAWASKASSPFNRRKAAGFTITLQARVLLQMEQLPLGEDDVVLARVHDRLLVRIARLALDRRDEARAELHGGVAEMQVPRVPVRIIRVAKVARLGQGRGGAHEVFDIAPSAVAAHRARVAVVRPGRAHCFGDIEEDRARADFIRTRPITAAAAGGDSFRSRSSGFGDDPRVAQ